MARQSRAEQVRPQVDETPDVLWIPPKFKEHMEAEGFVLRWIRFTEGNDKIDRHFPLKRQRGWEFVRPEEVKEYDWHAAPVAENGSFGSVIQMMDTVLMKRRADLSERDQRQSEKRASDLFNAVKNNLKMSNAQMDRYAPLTKEKNDGFEIKVTGGRQTKFGE